MEAGPPPVAVDTQAEPVCVGRDEEVRAQAGVESTHPGQQPDTALDPSLPPAHCEADSVKRSLKGRFTGEEGNR